MTTNNKPTNQILKENGISISFTKWKNKNKIYTLMTINKRDGKTQNVVLGEYVNPKYLKTTIITNKRLDKEVVYLQIIKNGMKSKFVKLGVNRCYVFRQV